MNRRLIDGIRIIDEEIIELDNKIKFLEENDKGTFKILISNREFSKNICLQKRNFLVSLVNKTI